MKCIRVAGMVVGGGIIAALSFKTAFAQATTPEGRLKILQDQINSLQQQLEQLKTTTDKKFESDPIVTFPNNRPTIGNKNASLAIGTQVQFDMGGYFQNGNTDDVVPAGARELNTGSNLRRARLFVVGKYYDWTVNLTPDFGGSPDGAVSLYEANLNYTMKPVTATIGFFKPWYSLQDSMSSNDFLFMERPSIVEIARNVAAGDARASIGAKGNGDQWFASAYITGGNWGDQNVTLLNEEQLGAVGRIAARPLYGEDWNVHVGVSGSYMFNPPQSNVNQPGDGVHNIQLRDRPELRVDMNRLIDTGLLDTDAADTWGFELGGNWRNFLLQGEYIRIDVDRRGGDDNLHFQGGYVEGSWVITGEQRKYNAGAAAFARPVPEHPFDPINGERGWGAWELAARYSVTDLNDDDINGGNQQVYSASLSWYPNALVRFLLQGSYVDVDRENAAGTTEIGQDFWDVALRSQIAF